MEEQNKELTVIKKIENQLQKPRMPAIYPLYAMHRKELRALKDKNLGNLRGQLSNIKTLKKEEYLKKYSEEIKKEIDSNKAVCEGMNQDWDGRLKTIMSLLEKRLKLEKKTDTTKLDLEHGYNDVAKLLISATDMHRTFSFNPDKASKKIADEEFEKKFGKSFSTVSSKIDDIETKYEEAINFGDLEIVKQLYYMMKKSDKLFEKIKDLEV